MLTILDFNSLTDDEKAESVWQGTFLGDRPENDQIVQLYSLGSFYVEVTYIPATNRINGFHAFTNTQLLVPYLAQVKFNSR
jgi:hypothetical protein